MTVLGILLFVLFKKFRNDFKTMVLKAKPNILSLNLLSEALYISGNLTNNFATMLAPVALVLVVGSLQPLFVFIGGLILTLFLPKFSKENISKNYLLQKVISILLIIIGSYFLYFK